MSLIRIKVDEVKSLNVQLRRNTSDLITVKMRVSALRYSVDSRVLGRRNIGGRINSVANSLNSIEAKLENLQLFINKATDRYSQADDEVRNKNNSISKLSKENSSLLNINLFKAFSDIKKSVQKEFKVFEKDANDFIKELDKFAEKALKSMEINEKYAELIGNSLFTLGKLEWEKYKKDDPIMAGIKVGVLETLKSMTVDLVVGIFDQVKGIITNPIKKMDEYAEVFNTINAVILPLTPEDEIIANKVYNGIWTEVKKGFEKEVIKGDAYTRSKYAATLVSTIATFFVGVGEVKAVESGAKTTAIISETAETVKIIDKVDDGLKIVNDADDVISKAGEITKEVGNAELVFKNAGEYFDYINNIGKRLDLSSQDKIKAIQEAYEALGDAKGNITCVADVKYIKGFDKEGRIIYDWPSKMGFEPEGIKSITRENSLPNEWDRIGSMSGENFTTIPENNIPYTNGERAIPYLDNAQARHIGSFNDNNYFDIVDAIKDNDIDKLNIIMKNNGCDTVSSIEMKRLNSSYQNFTNRVKGEIGDIDAPYGLSGNAAPWKSGGEIYMNGGAKQIVAPFKGDVLERLGILVEKK